MLLPGMLLPGTFLGVWNLISISKNHGNATPPATVFAANLLLTFKQPPAHGIRAATAA
jgi:hypothetical protein